VLQRRSGHLADEENSFSPDIRNSHNSTHWPSNILLFLHRLYSPCRTLVSFRAKFHVSLSLANFIQPLNTHVLQNTHHTNYATPTSHLFVVTRVNHKNPR